MYRFNREARQLIFVRVPTWPPPVGARKSIVARSALLRVHVTPLRASQSRNRCY